MKKTSTNPTIQKGNLPAKQQAGDPLKLPTKPPARPPTVASLIIVAATTPTPKIPTTMVTTTIEPQREPESEDAVVQEFLQKFGSGAKVRAALARISAMYGGEEASQTPLKTPPQPSPTQETHITQASTLHPENPKTSTDVPASNQPHAEESAVPDENTDKSEAGKGRDGVEGDALVKGMQRMDVGEKGKGEEQVESEWEDTVDTGKGSELKEGIGICRVEGSRESGKENVSIGGEENVEGEIPSENLEGEIPVVGNLEGETPVVGDVEGETPVGSVEGETPVGMIEGKTPNVMIEGGILLAGETPAIGSVEGKAPIESEEVIPRKNMEEVADDDDGEEESEKEIVNLEDDEETTPVDERTTRRTTRRSKMIEELAETTRPRKLQFGASVEEAETEAGDSEAKEEQEADEDIAQAEEKRLAAERKRKEKLEAEPLTKKHRPASSTLAIEEPTPETIRVPFAKGLEGPGATSEAEDDEDVEQPEEPNYEMTEVLVTKKLLEAMAEFDDQKRVQTYKERGASGKLVKSRKRYDPESL